MKKNIILGGVSLALFAVALIFFINSGASSAVATDSSVNQTEKPAACQRLTQEGSCGCTANNGSCSCGRDGGSGCAAASGATNTGKASCGCQKANQ